jgi:predicted RNA-binding Zn-ribbon protein involved in translation (DUF1610 family)
MGTDDSSSIKDYFNICCPNCGSKDILVGLSDDGYVWIDRCNKCGYKGEQGDSVGCLDKIDIGDGF